MHGARGARAAVAGAALGEEGIGGADLLQMGGERGAALVRAPEHPLPLDPLAQQPEARGIRPHHLAIRRVDRA